MVAIYSLSSYSLLAIIFLLTEFDQCFSVGLHLKLVLIFSFSGALAGVQRFNTIVVALLSNRVNSPYELQLTTGHNHSPSSSSEYFQLPIFPYVNSMTQSSRLRRCEAL
nr:MAG TPA: hypothetical protein [Caudoviricetes sp.]